MRYVTTVGEHSFDIEIEERGEILVDGRARQVDLQEIVAGRLYSLLLDHVSNQSFVLGGRGDSSRCCSRGNSTRSKLGVSASSVWCMVRPALSRIRARFASRRPCRD